MLIGMCGAEFPDVREFLAREMPEAEIVVIDHGAVPDFTVDVLLPGGGAVGAGLMDAARPKLIQQFGVGLQGVDLEAARERGIEVRNLPAADTGNAAAVAELVLFHLLALLRRFPETVASVLERRVGQPIGATLAGKTVAVLGTGAIGQRVLELLEAFGAEPVGIGRRQDNDLLPPGRYFPSDRLDEALKDADALVVCVPLTGETRGMVGSAAFAAMPPGGYLVNVGRGAVVDYQALLDALRDGRLAGAGLDVTWTEPMDPADPLLEQNVLVTPHVGGVTRESYAQMAAAFAASVRSVV